MKQFTLYLALAGSLVMSSSQAAPTTLHQALPYLVGLNATTPLSPFADRGEESEVVAAPDTSLQADVTSPADSSTNAIATNDTPAPAVAEVPASVPDTSDEQCDCTEAPRTAYTFASNNESFSISFPAAAPVEPVAAAGFQLFFSSGDIFSLLVAAPRQTGDENIAGLLQTWRDLLERRYPNSPVAQVSRSAVVHANGQVSLDSLFFITSENKFVRARIVLSNKNSYVLSTTFPATKSEDSNLFFEDFQVIE